MTRKMPRPGIARFNIVANTSARNIEIGIPTPAMMTLWRTAFQKIVSWKMTA